MRLIDADKLKEMTCYNCHEDGYELGDKYCRWEDVCFNLAMIKKAPTVDAEPVRYGRWIRKEWAEESEGLLIDNYECSACKSLVRNETNYCPNCGAMMDAERKEE